MASLYKNQLQNKNKLIKNVDFNAEKILLNL